MHKFMESMRHAPKAQRVSDVDAERPIRLTVVLKPGASVEPLAHQAQPVMSRSEYRTRHGTHQAVLDRVVAYAKQHGLRVIEADAAKHAVRLEGTYGQACAAFQPEELGVYHIDGRDVVARGGHLFVPDDLAQDVVAVMGFDQRPVAKPHFRVRPATASATSWDPVQLAEEYEFPTGLNGSGQTVALIELGGGFSPDDVALYFSEKDVKRTGKLDSVGVDGATNAPHGDTADANGEVQLDIDVVGSVAPGANIVVYFGPNQGNGFLDAVQAAIHDETNDPSVISISWGGPESNSSSQDLQAMDQALQSAAALGVTVCVASGDNGATDGETDGALHVDFPASSPHALACGGTRLPKSGKEVAWNDGSTGGATGGGFSSTFPRPSWQVGVPAGHKTQRGVPDVAGNADPETGYNIRVDGKNVVVGGTSAVAPLWAGLIALANQSLGKRVGFVNPILYQHPEAFVDITQGNNNGFKAGHGWDPVTGLGRPKGAAVIDALKAAAATA
jgi:kumamolisin